MAISGIQAFLTVLANHGVKKIFGNPGTTELPLNDALIGDDRFEYVLGLHETPLMAMADGYAMATGDIAVVNLHACCGLGNAMGGLYNAFREGTPLLVTAGQQDRRLLHEEAILGGDMVSVVRPWTKWADEARSPDEVATLTRRAIQRALTPPRGPVFLSLPLDVQMMPCASDVDLSAPTRIDHRLRPSIHALPHCVFAMAEAKRPAIIAGSRVTERGAIQELIDLAEAWGAPVFSEPGNTHGRLPYLAGHRLYGQMLPLWSPDIHARLQEYDTIMFVGLDVMRQYVWFEPQRPIPKNTKLIHVDDSPAELGKNYPMDVAVWGDIRTSLSEIAREWDSRRDHQRDREVLVRRNQAVKKFAEERERLETAIAALPSGPPIPPAKVMAALSKAFSRETIIVEEAVTSTGGVLERLGTMPTTEAYFGHRGWTLGWGSGCAIGAKLAWPDRPALAILGDGAALYGLQSLWTAAKYNIPVTFLVLNNRQYQVLMTGSQGLNLEHAVRNEFLGLDLSTPAIDYLSLARGYGVESERIDNLDALVEALKISLHGDKPRLIEVPITRDLTPLTT